MRLLDLPKNPTKKQLFDFVTYRQEEVDRYLNDNAHNYAVFDPIVGYRNRNCLRRDAIDGSYSINNYETTGQRRQIHYPNGKCRLNSYGNSFTQCMQTNDGETWQEILAAHFGEPIRNFGTGSHGFYQAYRRMKREEMTKLSAEYVILNCYDDDHYRSLHSWHRLWIPEHVRRLRYYDYSNDNVLMMHSNPWAHIKYDLESGTYSECENPFPTPESLYRLCDPEYVYELYHDDLATEFFLAYVQSPDTNREFIAKIADRMDVVGSLDGAEQLQQTAQRVFDKIALRATMFVCNLAKKFCDERGKTLLVVTSYSEPRVIRACEGGERFDSEFISFLEDNGFHTVDSLESHLADWEDFSCSPRDYVNRYYINHYNPKGNHFFAFAIKDKLLRILDPSPITYSDKDLSMTDHEEIARRS